MKITHIQFSMSSAGSAAFRLHTAFLAHGIDSSILSLLPPGIADQKIMGLRKRNKIAADFDQRLQAVLIRKHIKPDKGLFSYPILGNDISKHPLVANSDVIYVHWVLHGFLNLKNFEQLVSLGKPVIFFLHDMWSITGGCHHSFECEKYTTACIKCPMFDKETTIDWAASEFQKKKSFYSKSKNIFFITPSTWLQGCTQKSALTRDKPIFYIPNILDRTIFKPFAKQIAKQILNIDPDETVIAFGAMALNNPYKGWEYLKSALEILKSSFELVKISALIFGSNHNQQIANTIPFKTKFMGYLKDEYISALVYNAADVFVAPSLADNLPFTVLESLACGTPVTAFRTGGIPDMVIHKKNGYLADYKDAKDLAEGIKFCISEQLSGYLAEQFNSDEIIKKHKELINEVTL